MHLDKNQIAAIEAYLQQKGLLGASEKLLSAEKAGEGNMNYTIRVRSSSGSFILKQARPYVEKYPSIPAPVERAGMEAAFFAAAAEWANVGDMLPRLLHFDAEEHIQVIEDLGKGADFTAYYARKEALPEKEVARLLRFLAALHRHSRQTPPAANFENRAMRELNHLHIFDFPFQADNGLDLDGMQEGLQALAQKFIFKHPALLQKTLALGQRYLADGDTLLHGDYFPGSWLHTSRGVFVIDPEFCFRGEAAFDLGVCLAHLCFCGMSWEAGLALLEKHYGTFDRQVCEDFAAVEILRRFYGVAQLPLSFSIAEKAFWTEKAVTQLLHQVSEPA